LILLVRWAALRVCLLLIVAGLWAEPAPACAQGQVAVYDATGLREPEYLKGPWLVHAGDDPAYARADFDDSKWMVFDATKPLLPEIAAARPEVVWYRLHVKVSPGQAGLALQEFRLASAFEVYVNGARLLQTGRVKPFAPATFVATLVAPLPGKDIATGSVVIALRVHVSPSEWSLQYAGLYYQNLMLGMEREMRQQIWLSVLGSYTAIVFNDLFLLGLGLVALALYLGQRSRKEYLWIFLMAVAANLGLSRDLVELFRNVPTGWDLATLPIDFAYLLFTCLMFFAFVRLRLGLWLRIYLVAALVIFGICFGGYALGILPAVAQVVEAIPISLLLYAFVPVLLILRLRKGDREAGILLIPVLALAASGYLYLGLQIFGVTTGHFDRARAIGMVLFEHPAGPFLLSIRELGFLLFNFSLTLIVVLRSTRMSQQQAMLEHEIAAAREVQQVILPEQTEAVAGFTVESAYEPAQQVGGDFFQVLPVAGGGLLLVLGDVAGHGLPAAMLVSVLVGAIRAAADYTNDPAEMLANLNERLVGRTHGSFSTALVASITADGRVTVANAGHLSPYLDGEEIELLGALPLGVAGDARYETTRFWLPPGSRLTFYSDGVVEARDEEGALFGFERGKAISVEPAAEIVAAAKSFGQEDDITVVTIKRHAAIAIAA
jgi:phosphoserine phosphatase RsbU/P